MESSSLLFFFFFFFADDLVLISRTLKRGLERMLRVVNRFCLGMHLKLAVNKTVIISGGATSSKWASGGDDGNDLESTLIAKYLGIAQHSHNLWAIKALSSPVLVIPMIV